MTWDKGALAVGRANWGVGVSAYQRCSYRVLHIGHHWEQRGTSLRRQRTATVLQPGWYRLQQYAVILTPHPRLPGLTISESWCPADLSSKLGVTEMGQLHRLALWKANSANFACHQCLALEGQGLETVLAFLSASCTSEVPSANRERKNVLLSRLGVASESTDPTRWRCPMAER